MKNFLAIIFVLLGAAASRVFCDYCKPDNTIELCDCKKDLDCLRKFFSENAVGGSVVQHPTEVPYYEVELPIYLPSLNLSSVCTKDYLGNLNGDIERAYIDKEAGTLVLSVNFKGLYINAPDTYFAFSRDGSEPKVFQEEVNCTYPTILTAVIPFCGGITTESMKKGHYSAYFPDKNAKLVFGPKLSKSKDPQVIAAMNQLQADIPTALKEIFWTKASYYFIAYLQNYVYNFFMSPVIYDCDLTVFKRRNEISCDDPSNYAKVCDDCEDLTECARNYFDENSSGSVVRDSNDDAVTREMFEAYVPYLNLTAYTTNAKISQLNGEIKDLYINKVTKNLVMTVVFSGIILDSSKTYIVFSQRGGQPVSVADRTVSNYPVSLTAIIPMCDDGITADTIKKSIVSAYFTEKNAYIELGCAFTESNDPQVQSMVQEVQANPTDVALELFTTEAYGMFLAYLQKYICNFGIPLSTF